MRYALEMLSQWVAKSLEHAGIGQAELGRQLSDRLGVPYDRSMVNKIVKGRRDVSPEEMTAIAEILGVPVPDEYSPNIKATVPLVGRVRAGSEMALYEHGQGPFDYLDAPDDATPKTVAVLVDGDSLGRAFNGWLIFYDDVQDPPTDALFGKLCVVGIEDGRILVKTLERGGVSGAYTLHSNVEAPIYDVYVKWAAKVKSMRPRR